jgi:uncharacterized LabA/DUF88 family protein
MRKVPKIDPDVWDDCFPHCNSESTRLMIFVDGENLAIRYSSLLGDDTPAPNVSYQPGVFVWSETLIDLTRVYFVRRKYYYTSLVGDSSVIEDTTDKLKKLGIEAPRVFKKTKGKGSKRVDISLATDMLVHASRRNINVAVLIAGDEDYVPLVEAVQLVGCRVLVWFIPDGISPALKRAADAYANINPLLFESGRRATA